MLFRSVSHLATQVARFVSGSAPELSTGENVLSKAPAARIMQFSDAQGVLFLTDRRLVFLPNLLAAPSFLLGRCLSIPTAEILTIEPRKRSRLRALSVVPAFTVTLISGKSYSFHTVDAKTFCTELEAARAAG